MLKFLEAPSYAPNYVKAILDEIALEGLDGITPNDLWLRLSERPFFPFKPKDEAAKCFLWEAVKRLKSVLFYELPEPRPTLVIFNRFEHLDPELGMIVEPKNMPENIYPHCKVVDTDNDIVGSCATYYTRRDVTSEVRTLSYSQVVQRWGHKLAVVASQEARRRALQNSDVNPNLELTTMQYIVLERVGRSRYHGEITQGQLSLQVIGEDAKSLFYLRKVLHKHRLITKQMFHQKMVSNNSNGLLLHLPRFFVERRPKALLITEKVVLYLKQKPNKMEEYRVLREALDLEATGLKKLSKTNNFQKFVKMDMVLYRVMYPEATETEWRYKAQDKEKLVRVYYLTDPDVDIKDIWQKYDDVYDDEDDDKCGLLDESHRLLDRTMMAQTHSILEQRGPEGLTQVELSQALGVSKLSARLIMRNLTRNNKVTMFMKDIGRQRTARFALNKFDECSKVQKQMIEEKDKLLKLVSNKEEKNEDQLALRACEASSLVEESVDPTAGPSGLIETPKTQSKAKKTPKNKIDKTHLTKPNLPKEQQVAQTEDVQATISEPNKKETVAKGKKRKTSECKEPNSDEPTQPKKKKKNEHAMVRSKAVVLEPVVDIAVDEDKTAEMTQALKEEIEVIVSKPDLSELYKKLFSNRSGGKKKVTAIGQSFRLLKRTNLIIEAIHKHQVIIDTSKLQKMIYEEERKEGLDVKMDKKSLLRIMLTLTEEGHIQQMQTTLRGYGREKVLTFICHPSVTPDHSAIQSAIDQAKMKFNSYGRDTLKKKVKEKEMKERRKPVLPQKTGLSLHETIPSDMFDNIHLKHNSHIGRVYGFKPKYMRMQVLHKYLYYLIYGYEGDQNLDQDKAVAEMARQTPITEETRAVMTHVYTPSLDWRMFLPPLPTHIDYPSGWALMSDMLLRLPLSIFVQIVNVGYEVPEMEHYLNHPIKRHLLVKDLPLHFRIALTYARKYIFTIHEQIQRLCCTGLLQLGPQRLKEKDQVFVYLNRRAVLWDTTSSPEGYHQIAKDREYPVHHYHFLAMTDVEQYWHDLWNFCMQTMLGGRMCMKGKEVVVEGLHTKLEVADSLESRTVDEAPKKDLGYLPGDHLGAAGFDSSMFSHLKRNWYWNTSSQRQPSDVVPKRAMAPSTDLNPVKVPKPQQQKVPKQKQLRVITETSSARRRVGRREPRKEPREKLVRRRPKHKRTVRLLKGPKRSARKPYYDQVDRAALLNMSKLRVDWSENEDNTLLLCKVAVLILQTVGHRYQNLATVRQILHEYCPEATDKTSRACQRRLNYMMKNARTQRSVHLCVEEMRQDTVVMRKLQDMLAVMKAEKLSSEEKERHLCDSYKTLVTLLQERYKRLHSQELSRVSEGFLLPDTKDQLLEKYRVLKPKNYKRRGFNAIHTVHDIQASVINSTILSSLNCIGDKTSWSYQLFNIYQQYPDKLLRSVMAKTRADAMVSLRKNYLRTHMRSGDYLPLSSTPYQLSISYINLLMTRYQFELYAVCRDMFTQLWDSDCLTEVVAGRGGVAACIVEAFSQDTMEFQLQIPEQIIVMDPSVVQRDETYTRIVQRYQDILSKSKDPGDVTITSVFDDPPISQPGESLDGDPEEGVVKSAQTVVAKAATRIALYFTREESDRTEKASVEQQEMQHAHDFFVVNASKVFCRFKKAQDKDESELDLHPLPKITIERFLRKIRRMAMLPEKGVVRRPVPERRGVPQELLQELTELIRGGKELGLTVDKIREVYGLDREVAAALQVLVDSHVCLRSGVNKTHYIHSEYLRPWVIRSFHHTRLEKEKSADVDRLQYSLVMNIGENMESSDITAGDVSKKEPKDTEPTPSTSSAPTPSIPSTSSAPTPSLPSTSSAPTPLGTTTDTHVKRSSARFISTIRNKLKKTTFFDKKTKCDLTVCVRPWIRINGSLNRKVLDKFLSSVLGHVLVFPLCSLKSVQERFTPAFQPHHTRELVEMLCELGCVRLLAVRLSQKTTLFSKPSHVTVVAATGLEREEDLLVEPDGSAITRLSLFVGESAHHRVTSDPEVPTDTDYETKR